MTATARLCVLLCVVGVSVATPYYLQPQQQRQLFYPVAPQYAQYPQYPQYSQYSAPALPYRQVYYAPQTAANLVAPVPSALQYSAPHATPPKQVLYYPGASPYPGNFVLAGDEASEGSTGGWTSWISNLPFASYIPGLQPAAPESPAAAGGEGASGVAPAAPEKVEQPTKEEEKEDVDEEKPKEEAKVKGVPQKYVLLSQPQFFGNYGLQRVNPAMVLPSANHGAVSSYLLLKNFPGVRFAPQIPQVHQVPQAQQVADAEQVPAGEAALGYQRLVQAAQAVRQQKEYEDAVSVDAAQRDSAAEDKPVSETVEAEKEDDEEPGPTVAQAKPKAIALAGPGGVASAAPVGTALVGPGGMAISAPEATAVAGVKGGATGVISPATTKHATKALRTFQLANQNLTHFLSL